MRSQFHKYTCSSNSYLPYKLELHFRMQTLKRTEPVVYCRTGGVHTYNPKLQELSQYDDTLGKEMTQHKAIMRKIRKTSAEAKFVNQAHFKELTRQRLSILKGEKSKLQEFASTVAEKKQTIKRTKK